jgi:hypothetical protein
MWATVHAEAATGCALVWIRGFVVQSEPRDHNRHDQHGQHTHISVLGRFSAADARRVLLPCGQPPTAVRAAPCTMRGSVQSP